MWAYKAQRFLSESVKVSVQEIGEKAGDLRLSAIGINRRGCGAEKPVSRVGWSITDPARTTVHHMGFYALWVRC